MIRIFHTGSGLKKAVDKPLSDVVDISLLPFSKNSLMSALKVSKGIYNTGCFNAGCFNRLGINIHIFIDKTKKDLILSANEELAEFFKYKPDFKPNCNHSSISKNHACFREDNFSICVKTYDFLSDDFLGGLFDKFNFIVFFLALGAAVRLISSHIKDKLSDPAVIAVDEMGKFAISLLSGHTGGGNEFTKSIANFLEAVPVITTATDVAGRFSIDMFAKKFGYFIEDARNKIKYFNKASLNAENFIIYLNKNEWINENRGTETDSGIYFDNYLKELTRYFDGDLEAQFKSDFKLLTDVSKLEEHLINTESTYINGHHTSGFNLIVISKKADIQELCGINSGYRKINVAVLRPKNLVIGIGCNKNTDFDEIDKFILSVFKEYNLSLNSIRNIATIDIKKDEDGILRYAERYAKFIDFYTKDEINEIVECGKNKRTGHALNYKETEIGPEPANSFCYQYTGAYSVCEPCALLSSENKELLICKKKKGNVTMAAALAITA